MADNFECEYCVAQKWVFRDGNFEGYVSNGYFKNIKKISKLILKTSDFEKWLENCFKRVSHVSTIDDFLG